MEQAKNPIRNLGRQDCWQNGTAEQTCKQGGQEVGFQRFIYNMMTLTSGQIIRQFFFHGREIDRRSNRPARHAIDGVNMIKQARIGVLGTERFGARGRLTKLQQRRVEP